MDSKPGKPTMRAVCAILDAFHFTLPWELEDRPERGGGVKPAAEAAEEGQAAAGGADDDDAAAAAASPGTSDAAVADPEQQPETRVG